MCSRRKATLGLVCCGVLLLVDAGFIQAKAVVAQMLIARAWQAGTEPQKPWPWADIVPVAKLTVPSTAEEFYVMSGAHGQSLAFGPGHVSESRRPGDNGISVIGGHRDTHFRHLGKLKRHDELVIEQPAGSPISYRVEETLVVDSRWQPIDSLGLDEGVSTLVLVTCYPFTGELSGGPERFLVIATAHMAPS